MYRIKDGALLIKNHGAVIFFMSSLKMKYVYANFL
nr:hypothetical protein SEEM971_13126 [Salmonella enterica subsp. enterica serovar Montevideo str. 495297-1]